MQRSSPLPCAYLSLVAVCAIGGGSLVAAEPLTAELRTYFATHCVDCHGPKKQESDLRLDVVQVDFRGPEALERWEKVLDRIEAGEMPPMERPRPPAEQTTVAVHRLHKLLERGHAAIGTAHLRQPRRLNRIEYQNTVNELLGIDLDLVKYLPEDGLSEGFDKVGRALSISPVLVERYMEAADAAIDEALSEREPVPTTTERYTLWDSGVARRTYTKNGVWAENHDAVIVWNTNDKYFCIEPFKAPQRGKYRVRISAYGTLIGRGAERGDSQVVMTLHGGNFRPEGRSAHLVGFFDVAWEEARTFEAVDLLEAGHTFKITIAGRPPKTFDVTKALGPALAVQWVDIEGPLYDGAAERRKDLLLDGVDPAKGTQDDADRLLAAFATRAFRRPADDAELAPYRAVMHAQFAAGAPFREALHVGLKTILCSPEFLFLERRPAGLDDYDVAARLSYFLWNGPPDAELLTLASAGKLRDAAERRRQAERMLADPKSANFTHRFLDSWLELSRIDFTTPDRDLYPEFDEPLRDAMLNETRMFFDELLQNDLSLLNLIDSDFAFVNERLARHYGLPGIRGTEVRKVSLPKDSVRGGVLTQAAILKVTADGTVTSPVLRGVWLLSRIMGTPVPPPPPSVPGLEPDVRGATTIREQLAKHRTLPMCSSCHRSIDPPGFALENFDPIGGWRDHYRIVAPDVSPELDPNDRQKIRYKRGPAIEAGDQLPDGRRFADVRTFKKLLLTDPDGLATNVAAKLFTYAVGREPEFPDRAELTKIVERDRGANFGLRSLIKELAASDAFVKP